MLTFGSNVFAIGGAGLVIEPGPGLTAAELRTRSAYLAHAAIGSTRRVARAFVLSLARRATAELSRLARWRVAEVEAIEATPGPVATGRGPPVHGTANLCEWATSNNRLVKGGPMATINEKAPRIAPRDPLKIFHDLLAADSGAQQRFEDGKKRLGFVESESAVGHTFILLHEAR